MRISMLKSKLHRATVTGADLDYEGSIALGPELIAAARFRAFERVEIYNVNTGARFATYVIPGEQGQVCLNGAAARLVQRGDRVIICSYAEFDEAEASVHVPTVVLLDEKNQATIAPPAHAAGFGSGPGLHRETTPAASDESATS
jgi:aspartate 1-decarboxylase